MKFVSHNRKFSFITRKQAIRPIEESEMNVDVTAKACVCTFCKAAFSSKTQLFKHLSTHGYEGPNTKPERAVLLVGWLAGLDPDNDAWVGDLGCTSIGREVAVDRVEEMLYRAQYALENGLPSTADIAVDVVIERPKGSSRASSVVQRSAMLLGVESSCHGLCDTFCLNVKAYAGAGGESEWLERMNALLPAEVRVLHRYTLTSEMHPRDLHAEVSCTQQRYEYMLPLRLVMPPTTQVLASLSSGGDGVEGEEGAGDDEEDDEEGNEDQVNASSATKQPSLISMPRKIYHGTSNAATAVGIHSMDQRFPVDTAEGQARIVFFRNLKRIAKMIAGRKSFHNYATGGASPEDAVSVRKIDRIYHKELISISGEPWVVFSVSGDAFLRGQVRRVLGVAIAIARGLLPENYFTASVGKSAIVEVPALPGWGLYLAESKYAYYEAKFEDFRLDPRRVPGADCSRLDYWKVAVQSHIAELSRRAGDAWLGEFEGKCKELLQRHQQMQVLMSRPRPLLEQQYEAFFGRAVPSSTVDAMGPNGICGGELHKQMDATTPAVYEKVLRLLREADASGLWPANSTGRQKVILNAPAVEVAQEAGVASIAASNEDANGGVGDGDGGVKQDQSALPNADNTTDETKSSKAPRKHRQNTKNGNNKADKRAKKPKSEGNNSGAAEASDANDAGMSRGSTPDSATAEDSTSVVSGPAAPTVLKERREAAPQRKRITSAAAHLQRQQAAAAEAAASLAAQVTDPGVGGSFSVGCLPKHLAQPKGNALFPGIAVNPYCYVLICTWPMWYTCSEYNILRFFIVLCFF